MSFSMAGRGARGPEINVTPLIDVLLTLIIVFMVVVSMDKEQGETAQIPQPDQKQTAEHPAATHGNHPGGVDEGGPAANGEDQSGRRAMGGPGNATRGNLSKARGEGGLRARRCRRGLPVRCRCDRCGASRRRAASGAADYGSGGGGRIDALVNAVRGSNSSPCS